MADEKRKNTVQVLTNLLNSHDFKDFFQSNTESFVEESFCEHLTRLCDEKNIAKGDMIRASGIERTYAYQILRGARKPTRDKVIQMAIGLGLDVEETQALLRAAEQNQLYPRIKRDAAIIFCLNNRLSFAEIQIMLSEIDEKLLGKEE